MAALVDVPFFARSTVDPNSQIGAALVLIRFLIAVPIGPRTQRMATAASPAYLAAHGCPLHPRDLSSNRNHVSS